MAIQITSKPEPTPQSEGRAAILSLGNTVERHPGEFQCRGLKEVYFVVLALYLHVLCFPFLFYCHPTLGLYRLNDCIYARAAETFQGLFVL